MRLERGFRRIVIVLSASIVVLGAGLDVAFSPPRPDTVTVLVTLTNGRQVTLADVPRDVVPSPTDQALINTLAKDLGAGKKVFDLRKADSNVRQAVDRYSRLVDKIIEIPGFNTTRPNSSNLKLETFLVQWWDIRRVEVLRDGPQWWAWWWDHAYITSWAVGLAVFLWVAFYVFRWIARGFARK